MVKLLKTAHSAKNVEPNCIRLGKDLPMPEFRIAAKRIINGEAFLFRSMVQVLPDERLQLDRYSNYTFFSTPIGMPLANNTTPPGSMFRSNSSRSVP